MLEFTDYFCEESEAKVESIVDMLIVERMLIISDEFEDIDEVILDESIVLMDNLKIMDIFGFPYAVFLWL